MAALKMMDVKYKYLAKDSLFKGPFGWLFYALGGVPVDRSKHNSMVEAMAKVLIDADDLIVLIPPEGTRSAVTEWKTGFYHVARLAGVPILPGYLDYAKKEAGIAEPFHLQGDFDEDLNEIKAFYRTITPKYPEKWKV
jgi:1-acyl-sn-glycerol-3-phosphate acyltransferase